MMLAALSSLEHSEVAFGRTRIAYQVRRSQRRGTVSIAIDPEHGVLVTAPLPTTLLRLDGIVRQKGVWILRNLRDRAALTTPSFREFVSGETFHYLGRGYRLKVAKGGEDTTEVALRGGLLHVSLES